MSTVVGSVHQADRAAAWQRYALVHYFYGYGVEENSASLCNLLAPLIHGDDETLSGYGCRLLTLLTQVEGQHDALISLRSTFHSSSDFSPAPEVSPSPGAEQGETSTQFVFIIGPFAGKWFTPDSLAMHGDHTITWIAAPDASSLVSHIARLEGESLSGARMTAFFPLLADGFQSSAILIEQLRNWQHALAVAPLARRLPCTFGFYTRLSLQRYPHDPDSAIWTRRQKASGPLLEHWLAALESELTCQDNGKDLYAIQRRALGSTFFYWLAQSRIMRELQCLLDTTPLELAAVALADYGQGFTRHGDWSVWLGEHYGILPGLSASLTPPPLPDMIIPAPLCAPSPISAVQGPVTAPRSSRRTVAIATLLLLICLTTLYAVVSNHRRADETLLLPSRDIMRAAQATRMDSAPLFARNSSRLLPGSEALLHTLVPRLTHSPDQQVLIVGHSDNTGTAKANLALSTERARAIRNWLVTHTGLPDSHFIVEGAGYARPVASNDTQEGRAQNRRVEIILLPGQNHHE